MSDILIIGSGFGGSVAAKRFTEAGHRVTILELGERWADPNQLAQSQDPKLVFRLLRDYPADYLRTKPTLRIAAGMGLGGGSLVYAGIHLRAPAHAFEHWPAGWTRAHLDPYYARVEQQLAVAPMLDTFSFGRPQAFREGAIAAGLPPPQPLPLAMQGCTRCGWCLPICAFGKKRTMQHTYLADAERTGRLSVVTHRKAAYLARFGGRYRVWAWRTDGVATEYHRVNQGPLEARDADIVVVAGGAIESPVLLARSLAADVSHGAERLRAFPTKLLGRELDGTGDFVQGGLVPRRVDGFKGAVMMSYIDLGDYVLEDLHGLPVGAAITLGARLPGVTKSWGRAYGQQFRDWGQHMLSIAVVGKQGAGTERTISVRDDDGNAAISTRAYTPPPGALAAARSIITALGGQLATTVWEQSGTAVTVHPTGGCAMGDRADAVVRASDLELRDNPGVHVIDGSVLPANPLRNPAHTIAAVAERALDVILGVHRPDHWPT
ncbi:MAG TPA: GMC family oxidoreductase [Kofleriaceae bacterium]|jgi:cholesterol oxidase|nr:GMC family oxidoreductase [Kofleriaceae bacterium]